MDNVCVSLDGKVCCVIRKNVLKIVTSKLFIQNIHRENASNLNANVNLTIMVNYVNK